MDINFIIYLLFVHWLADFVLQSDRIAKEKSSNNLMLFYHCLIYGTMFAGATIMANYGVKGLWYGLLIGLIHFPVDYVTSRLNSKFYKAGKNHEFFVSIGFDQWIHFVTIILLGKALL